MNEHKFVVPMNAISFTETGEVEITDQGFAAKLNELKSNIDILSCTTNNGCGNTVNGAGCQKVNGKCGSSIIPTDNFQFVPGGGVDPLGNPLDLIRLKDYKLGKSVLLGKINEDESIGIAIAGLKEV